MILKENEKKTCQRSRKLMTQQENLVVLQRIGTEIEAKRNAPQELWEALRGIVVANASPVPPGLLHDVIEFCRAVFDGLEPNITPNERNLRVAYAETLAVGLNVRGIAVCKGLSGLDNAFLVKWTAITTTTIAVTRQANSDLESVLGMFVPFPVELQQVDHIDEVLAVWLHGLYSAIFLMAHGRIPAGVIGLASLGIGLTVRETRGMV